MEGWGSGSTRKWRKRRLVILRRDKYVCQIKIAGICKYRADCVHHVKGKKFGDDPQYLVAACTPCNLRIGEPEDSPSDPEPKPSSLLTDCA